MWVLIETETEVQAWGPMSEGTAHKFAELEAKAHPTHIAIVVREEKRYNGDLT